MPLGKRVVTYVERGDGLLVFDHRGHPEAGTQVSVDGGAGLTQAKGQLAGGRVVSQGTR